MSFYQGSCDSGSNLMMGPGSPLNYVEYSVAIYCANFRQLKICYVWYSLAKNIILKAT